MAKAKKAVRKRSPDPLRMDPSRTGDLRRRFRTDIRRRFIALKRAIRQLVFVEDTFALTTNVFCATGEGGGVDPSCSPGSGGSPHKIERVDFSKFGWHEEDDEYLYHVTTKERAERLEKDQAIVPGKRRLVGQGGYAEYSKGKVFLTERSGVKFWEGRVEDHLFDRYDDPPETAVVRIPKSALEGMTQVDKPGTEDAKHGSHYVEGPIKLATNVFCPTGPGGGVDPTCKLGADTGGSYGGMPKSVADMIKDYTEESNDVNLPLRKGGPESLTGRAKEIYETLQPLAKQSLPEPTTVYRGVHLPPAVEDSLVAGATVEFPGFSSTSPELDDAKIFGRREVMLKIKAKTGIVVGDNAFYNWQREIIQAHGTRYKVVGELDHDLPGHRRLIELEEVDPPTTNARYLYSTSKQKLRGYQSWLQDQIRRGIVPTLGDDEDPWTTQYAAEAYRRGQLRTWTAVRKPALAGKSAAGAKDEFIRLSLNTPAAKEKVQLLASRTYDDLKGVTETMATKMSRVLSDGMLTGASPRDVADELAEEVDLGETRALTIARTETLHAHNEGALDAMENLGVEELGVEVEWSTSGLNVCPICAANEGRILTIAQARGMFPVHPNCMCIPIPANVGESDE